MQKQDNSGQTKQSFSLKPAQQQAFLEVFDLHAVDGKISEKDLRDIFDRIGFKIREESLQEIVQKCFMGKPRISFEDFMTIFKVKESNYDLIDIKNAFRLIAEDSDDRIPVARLKTLFQKQGVSNEKVDELLLLLSSYIDKDGEFNFKMFLSHLS